MGIPVAIGSVIVHHNGKRIIGSRMVEHLYFIVQPVQRQVDAEDGHSLLLLVVDGHIVGYQWRLFVTGIEEWFSPIALVPAECLLEPLGIQVVVVLVAQNLRLDGRAVATDGIGAEPASLLGIVVFDKADTAAADARIGFEHALHEGYHLVGLVETVFDDGGRIDGGHVDIRRDAAYFFVFTLDQTVAKRFSTYFHHSIAKPEHQERRNAHDDQHAKHDAPCQPF